MRDLTRYLRKLLRDAIAEKNRIHKILQDANLKLTTYISDIFGVSGRALLESIINGEVLEADEIKEKVKTSLKRKVPEQAAWAASKSKGTHLASFFYRIQKRRGQKKATIATAHLILRMIYRILKDRVPYRETGWDYLNSSTSSVDYWIKKIEAQGFTVKIESAEAS